MRNVIGEIAEGVKAVCLGWGILKATAWGDTPAIGLHKASFMRG